jgi:protein-disulfide isomerase
MDQADPTAGEPTRRGVLFAVAAGTVSLAGCLSGDNGDGTDGEDTGNGTTADSDDDAGNSTDTPDDDGSTGNGDSGTENGDGGTEDGTADATGDGSETTAATVPVRGDPDADVTLEVYEDLGCPHCRNYVRNYFPDLDAEYVEAGRIRYEHRDFVVTGIAAGQAASAAREALARHGNDAFWAFTAAVYANQDRIAEGADLFSDLATDLEMDAGAIATAGADRAHQDVVERDMNRGQELGVAGTPSFVVDGELVDTSGAQTMADIVEAVSATLDEALDADPA